MTTVPSNLIPTRITQLPEYQGASTAGYLPYVIDGITYKVQFSNIAAVGAVPSSRTITGGSGLTGGGDLSADRVISIAAGGVGFGQLADSGVAAGTYGNSANIPVLTVDVKGRVTIASTTPIDLSAYVPTSRSILAGTGLSGGGTLAADRTISLTLSSAAPQPGGVPSAGSGTIAAREDHVHPAVDLSDTTETSGVLPMSRGGTGGSLSPVAGALVYSDGSKFDLTTLGSTGQALFGNGAGAPTWHTISTSLSGLTMGFVGSNYTLSGTLGITSGGTGATTAAAALANLLPSYGGNAGKILAVNGGATGVEWISPSAGSGTVTSVNVSGGTTGLTTSGGPVTTAGTITLAGTLATANGGTGQTSYTGGQLLIGKTDGTLAKATLTAGSNVTITNGDGAITIAATGGGGGASYEVGQIVVATDPPSTGTWLETGSYYSKATYSSLASVVGDVPDIGAPVVEPQAQLPIAFSTLAAPGARYVTATDGTTTVLGGTGGALRKTTDGVNWMPVISPWTTNIREVRYLNSTFIASPVGGPGSNGVVLIYSTDGLNWTTTYTGTPTNTNNPVSVAYGSGRYVAINGFSASGVAYSTDLINWTQGSFPSTANTINRLIFANSLFVAVGISSCFTSSDGITWTSRTIPAGTYTDVIYANGLYVAYGANGVISTSPDGVTWTSRSAGASTFNQIIYANSLFVAVGNSGVIRTSADGITWTAQTSGAGSRFLYGVAWNGSNFVVVGETGSYFTSIDGVTWTPALDQSLANFFQVEVINGKTVAFGNTASVVLAGASRTVPFLSGTWPYAVSTTSAPNPRSVAYNGSNQYVVGGDNGWLFTSADGNSWTGRWSGINLTTNGVFYLNGNYIGIGSSGSGTNLVTSADGVTWTARTAGTAIFNAAAFGASTYVVAGASGAVFSSADLATWTSRSAGAQTFNDVIFANSLFVAVGNAGTVYSSPDGVTWTSRSAGSTQFNRIIYDNSLFVAVGNSGVIYTSADGVTWTLRTSNVAGALNDVVWNGSIFCAVGASGVITTSPDGTTWTARTPGDTSVTLMSVAWSGTRFIVTNTTNTSAWTSTDGITWTRVFEAAPSGSTRRTSYIGGKFISVGASGWIQTSTDGLTWRASDEVQYVVTTVSRLQKIGGMYYALTANGMFQSSDGITFSAVRQIPAANFPRGVAYSGSAWIVLAAASGATASAVFKSTDGTTWTKSADLFNPTSTSSITVGVTDCVYASGNFIFGVSSVVIASAGLSGGAYTSPDGITWTPRLLPYGGFSGNASMASDGTTLLSSVASPAGIIRSSDGGVTWNVFASTPFGIPNMGYSSGVWLINTYVTDDLDKQVTLSSGLTQSNSFYVHNSKLVYNVATATNRILSQVNSAPQFTFAVPAGRLLPSTVVQTGKEYPVRGSTLMFAMNGATAALPFLIAECPLYSYDTGTTFWVPPQSAGGGQIAYIYAGP